jgi:hypothetical protein
MYGNLHYGIICLIMSMVNVRNKMIIPTVNAIYFFDYGEVMVEPDHIESVLTQCTDEKNNGLN